MSASMVFAVVYWRCRNITEFVPDVLEIPRRPQELKIGANLSMGDLHPCHAEPVRINATFIARPRRQVLVASKGQRFPSNAVKTLTGPLLMLRPFHRRARTTASAFVSLQPAFRCACRPGE